MPVEHGGGTNSVRQKGVSSHSASGEGSFSANQGLASGKFAFAANNNGNAQGENSAAFGYRSVAVGKNSFAEGNECIAYSLHSHAEGYDTLAKSLASHAEGVSTVAGDGEQKSPNSTTTAGYFSHAEGNGTLASGNSSHAEGKATQATQYTAHAEGLGTIANGVTSHAEGANTRAGTGSKQSIHTNTNDGVFTHAEGNGTLAKGNASHAEGVASESLARASHAEGYSTIASGLASHAEGYDTTASGKGAHAEGINTATSNSYEHAQGRYNKSNKASTTFGDAGNTIHSVGIGTSGNNKKNAFEIMQNGDAYLYLLGGYNGTNPGAAGVKTIKQEIDEKYIKPATGIPASDIADNVIPDVSQFITRTVNDLTNYYLKSETYTKDEVSALIGAIQQFHYEIYEALPGTGAGNVLYLIGPAGSGADKYEEYVYANGTFTKIGDTSIDLSGYVTTQALNTALADYTTTSNLTQLLSQKENISNKTTSLSSESTDQQYPSSKAVYDFVMDKLGDIETLLAAI